MDFSLADLAQRHHDGWAVSKTPHVGNVYPNNLAVGAAGIPLVLVDQTLGEKDANFHPHRVIIDGQSEVVSDPMRLTSHARIMRVSERVPNWFLPGASLMEAHVSALRKALPRALIETTSARARRMAHVMEPFLEVLTKLFPHAWQRYVHANGTVERRIPPQSWREVVRAGVHGLSTEGAGWIIPNAWNILGDGIIGAVVSGRETVYSLSGPDMIRYYEGLVPEMVAGYEAVRQRIGAGLPETLTMIMVPVAEMRLVTTQRRRTALDEVVETYQQIVAEKRARGAHMAGLSAADRPAAVHTLQNVRAHLAARMRAAVEACPEIFYRIQDATYLSQYDLLAGEELYVHPWGIEAPMASVVEMMNLLRRHQTST